MRQIACMNCILYAKAGRMHLILLSIALYFGYALCGKSDVG
jgi:hypothetical protein